eukprot:g2992.t1
MKVGCFWEDDGEKKEAVTLILAVRAHHVMDVCFVPLDRLPDRDVSHVVLFNIKSDVQQHEMPQDEWLLEAKKNAAYRFPLMTSNDVDDNVSLDESVRARLQPGYLCSQGFGGHFTHAFSATCHAIDLECPPGIPILAVRDCVVQEIRQGSKVGGIHAKNLYAWNSVLVRLDNGHFAEYVHIARGSCAHRVGDRLMDANENSLGPPFKVDSDHLLALERYPCPHQLQLKSMYAAWRKIKRDQVFVGVGSDEAIDLIIRMACVPGRDCILTLPPTYGMYAVSAQINDVRVCEVPLEDDFTVDVKKVAKAVKDQGRANPVKIVFVCHPNNPTGNDVASTKELKWLAESIGDALLIIDEAYVDFSERESTASSLVAQCPNVVVLQTFSKSWGLAGIRCGVALAQEDIVDYLSKMKAPYNLNKMTSRVAIRAMGALTDFKKTVDAVVSERNRVAKALSKMTEIDRVWPSHSNFILFRVAKAHAIYRTMADSGVVIRYRGGAPKCDECLRVSIGTKKENDEFLRALKETIGRV